MRYVPARRRTPGSNMVPTRVVVHGMVTPTRCGVAYSTGLYFQTSAAGGSAHLGVDPCEVVRYLPDGVIAQHAPPNTRSLGIEMADPVAGDAARWSDTDHVKMLALTAAEVRAWCLAYQIPMRKIGPVELRNGERGVCGHIDVSQAWRLTDHWDPGPTFPWATFMDAVRAGADPIPEEDDMTPDQARQLAAATKDANRAADQASVAAMQSAGAMRLAQVALSWAAVGGIPAGIAQIYQTYLGREPDAAGLKAWSKAATQHTHDEILLRIAATDEAKQHTATAR